MYKDQNLVKRYKGNPILSKKDIPYKADLIFNAGVIKYHGTYYMIFRNDYKGYPCDNNGLAGTNLGLAKSKDGIHWVVNKKPTFALKDHEIKRIYDPRLQVIDDEIYMCFACDTKHGIRGGVGKLNKSFSKLDIEDYDTETLLSITHYVKFSNEEAKESKAVEAEELTFPWEENEPKEEAKKAKQEK